MGLITRKHIEEIQKMAFSSRLNSNWFKININLVHGVINERVHYHHSEKLSIKYHASTMIKLPQNEFYYSNFQTSSILKKNNKAIQIADICFDLDGEKHKINLGTNKIDKIVWDEKYSKSVFKQFQSPIKLHQQDPNKFKDIRLIDLTSPEGQIILKEHPGIAYILCSEKNAEMLHIYKMLFLSKLIFTALTGVQTYDEVLKEHIIEPVDTSSLLSTQESRQCWKPILKLVKNINTSGICEGFENSNEILPLITHLVPGIEKIDNDLLLGLTYPMVEDTIQINEV